MQDDDAVQRISRKLDIVIGLLIQMRSRPRTEKEDILALQSGGMTSEEIARTLGKSLNSIYLVLSRNRRTKRQNG
jgi:DNA-directed RNA polymerase specialized sigma24 family protein